MPKSSVTLKRSSKRPELVERKQQRAQGGTSVAAQEEKQYQNTSVGLAPLVPLALDPGGFEIQVYRSQLTPGISRIDRNLAELKRIAGAASAYGRAIVPMVPPAGAAPGVPEETYGFGMDGLVEPFADSWDVNVKRLFGQALGSLGIPAIAPYNTYVCSNSGKMEKQKVDLVFIAQPAVKVNGMYRPSKTNRIGERSRSPTFWSHHMEKRQVDKKEKALLELGVRVLSSFLPEQLRDGHDAAADMLDRSGHGIGGHFQYCTFWGETAESFVRLADSPAVQMGRAAGFQAVFALKDGLLQNSGPEHGVRNYKFTSVDNFTTSKVAFLGFWQQCSIDRDDYCLLSVVNQSYPLGVALDESTDRVVMDVN